MNYIILIQCSNTIYSIKKIHFAIENNKQHKSSKATKF